MRKRRLTGPSTISMVATVTGLLPLFIVPALLGGLDAVPNHALWRIVGAVVICAFLGSFGAFMGLLAFSLGDRAWGLAGVLVSVVCAGAGGAFALAMIPL